MVLCRETRRPHAHTWLLTQCHDVQWETRQLVFQDTNWWVNQHTLFGYYNMNEVSEFLDGALWSMPSGRTWVERPVGGALKALLLPYGVVGEKFRIAYRHGRETGDLMRCLEVDHSSQPPGRVLITFGKDLSLIHI